MKSPNDSMLTLFALTILIAPGVSFPDPCPDRFNHSTIVDMCRENSARELAVNENGITDTVLIRVTIQDNCSCLMNFENATSYVSLSVTEIETPDSIPSTQVECGIEIIITRMAEMMSELEYIGTISCKTGSQTLATNLEPNRALQFKSKVLNGNFTTGHCIKIKRLCSYSTECNLLCDWILHDPCLLAIDSRDGTLQVSCEALQSNEKNSDEVTESSDSVNIGNVKSETKDLQLLKTIGSVIGGAVLVIVVIVVIVTCKCRASDKNQNRQPQQTNIQNEDYDSYELKDNILYVSSDDCSAFGDTNANVDSETNKPLEQIVHNTEEIRGHTIGTINQTPSTSRENTVTAEYAVVKKIQKEQIHHGNLLESTVEYAVVNKK